MKKTVLFSAFLIGCITLVACQQKNSPKLEEANLTDNATSTSSQMAECEIKVGDVTFTRSINGADTCVSLLADGALEFRCREGLDFFCDPNTLTAKVTPEITAEGLYNAADLFVYVNDTLWQKLAFEQDEYGNHRIVSVRTQGTSDDNNHDRIDAKSVYMKISSDTRTIASYYSLDKKEWHMVRLYRNYYPDSIYLGISSQCPQRGGCTSRIEDVTLSHDNVGDFRMGE